MATATLEREMTARSVIRFKRHTQTAARNVFKVGKNRVATITSVVTVTPADATWADCKALAATAVALEAIPGVYMADIPGLEEVEIDLREANFHFRFDLLAGMIAQRLNDFGVGISDRPSLNLDGQ